MIMVATLYEKFIEEMEKSGLRKVLTSIEENDVDISDNDEVIYIKAKGCQAFSIKGVRESTIRGKILTSPYYIRIKVYDNNYDEAKPEDAVQFGIAELKSGSVNKYPDGYSHVIYYYYPYRVASSGLKIKKGIVITKDKILEMKIIRNGAPIKIGKFELKIECDKWYRKDGKLL